MMNRNDRVARRASRGGRLCSGLRPELRRATPKLRSKTVAEAGFTLVEMLVVILIITLLMALLAVFVVGMIDRAAYAKTVGLVKMLDEGCRTYHVDYGAFPPKNRGDATLHWYLGNDRLVPVSRLAETGDIRTRKPPIIEFTSDNLQLPPGTPAAALSPVPIIDSWERVVQYLFPPTYNNRSVDIWSVGKDGVPQLDPLNANFDDVTNWNKEY